MCHNFEFGTVLLGELPTQILAIFSPVNFDASKTILIGAGDCIILSYYYVQHLFIKLSPINQSTSRGLNKNSEIKFPRDPKFSIFPLVALFPYFNGTFVLLGGYHEGVMFHVSHNLLKNFKHFCTIQTKSTALCIDFNNRI